MKKKKKQINVLPLSAALDRINQMLKHRFAVKNINYVTDNGIIKHGWLISNDESVDEAIILLQKQNAPIYLLGEKANAIFGWNNIHTEVVGSLWKNQKEIEKIKSNNFDEIKQKILEWTSKVN
jgi:hypothetical protein